MTWGFVALGLAAGAGVVGGAISANSSIKAGNRQADQFQDEAIREGFIAAQDERDLNVEVSRILGFRRARQGGQGVTSEGTPRLVDANIITETDIQALRIREGGQANIGRLQTRAGVARTAGVNAGISSVVGGVSQAASLAGQAYILRVRWTMARLSGNPDPRLFFLGRTSVSASAKAL